MDKTFKRHLMTYLDTGHRHQSMTDMTNCDHCTVKFNKGKALFERLQKEKPELFIYERPEFTPSEDTKVMFGQLMERIKKDKMYRRHIERLAHGTEEEKDEEIKKSNVGYYKTHYEQDGNIK